MKKITLFIFVLLMSLFVVACGDNTGGGGDNPPSGGGGENPPVEECKHVFNVIHQVEATCKEEGVIYYGCTKCGASKEEFTAKVEHKWGEWYVILEPTVNTTGLEGRACEWCGETENRDTPQLEHEHEWKVEEEVKGDCNKTGYKVYVCDCGETYREELETDGHNYSSWNIIKEADCSSNGYKERTCSKCGHTEQESIISTGHNIVNGLCTKCGQEDYSHLSFELNRDGSSYTLTYVSGNLTEVAVPETYNNLPVTNIEKGAFRDCRNIVSLTIPFVGGSIEPQYGEEMLIGYIFGSGFGSGKNIYNVGYMYVLPSSLTNITVTGGEISEYAFYYCENIKKIVIEESVTNVGKNAFDYCFNLEEIEFPSTLKTLYARFLRNDKLKKVDLSHCRELTYVEGFSEMEVLEEVNLPDSVETLNGFAYCPKLYKMNIPSSLVEISQGFLYSCPLITEIVISEGVTKIGINAFYYSGIKSVTIPSSVKTIEWSAFQDCFNLTSVTILDGVEYLGDNAFQNCSKLTELVLPATLTSIGSGIVNGCNKLETITVGFAGGKNDEESDSVYTSFAYIFGTTEYNNSYRVNQTYGGRNYTFYLPETLKEVKVLSGKIYGYAFNGCSKIEKIIIGNKVTSIGRLAITSCNNLQEIEFEENSSLLSIDYKAFTGLKISELIIPNSVENIGDYAFYEMPNLSKFEFEEGSNIKTIGSFAFQKCSSLKELKIPASLETIGEYALANTAIESLSLPFLGSSVDATSKQNLEYYFYSVPQILKTVEINSGVELPRRALAYTYIEHVKLAASIETIGEYAFDRCQTLKTIEFESGSQLKSIGEGAFSGCWALESFEIPSSITEILDQTFYNTGLTTIIIPNTITSIGNSAFSNCGSLSKVEFEENSQLEEIKQRAFSGCYNLVTLDLPNSLKKIKEQVFESCNNLAEITLPEGLISLGEEAFSYCYNLKTIVLPNSLETIEKNIFYNCSRLESITIPFIGSDNTKEGAKSFVYLVNDNDYVSLDSLETLIVTNAKYITDGCFSGLRNLQHFELSDSVEEIGDYILSSCESLETLVIPYFGHTKDDTNEYASSSIYGSNLRNIKEFTVLYATCIYENLFSYSNIEVVNLPDMLEEIKYNAFNSATNLKTINFPESLKRINVHAFMNCRSLEEIAFPESLEIIEDYAFADCANLKTLELNGNMSYFGEYAFAYCTGLEEIKLNGYISEIPEYAFAYCAGLEEIQFNGTINTIKQYAFANCSSLKKAILADSINNINQYAFSNCSSLEEVKLPASLNNLDSYTFENCSSLQKVDFNDCAATISANVFVNCNRLSELVIPNSIGDISAAALAKMSGLEKLTLPLTKILGYYFGEEEFEGSVVQNLSDLGIYYVPSTLKEVNITKGDLVSFALANLEKIEKVSLLDSVSSIYSNVFYGMTSLEELNIDSCVKVIFGSAFNGISHQLNWNNPVLTTIETDAYKGYLGDKILIPSSVTEIKERAFNGVTCEIDWTNANIDTLGSKIFKYYGGSTITIPSSVKYLSEEVFSGYAGEIIWDNPTIESIGTKVYTGYEGSKVVVPESVISISTYAFNEYNGESITLLGNVKEINEYAFYKFAGEIIWDNPTIEKIGYRAFAGYSGTKLEIPNTVKEIEGGSMPGGIAELVIPFVGRKLESEQTYSPENVFAYIFTDQNAIHTKLIKQEYKEAYYSSGDNISSDGNYYVEYYLPSTLKKVTVTGGYIGYGAFSGCNTLEYIDVSQTQMVYNYAFKGCTSLREVKLPESANTIYTGMFKDCISLIEFEVPSNITTIHQNAFRNCASLKKIILNENLDTIYTDAFYQCYNLKEVYNLSGLDIKAGELLHGAIGLYAKAVYDSLDVIRDFIVIDDKYEFYYDKLSETYSLEYYFGNDTELELPEYINDTVYTISDYAFLYASSLEKVTIPNTVQNIGAGIFKGCGNIVELTLPYVGENPNYNEASEVTLLGYLFGSVEYENSQLVQQFIDNPEITLDYYFPAGLHKVRVNGGNILSGAFSNLISLDKIEISSNVKEIGDYAFYKTAMEELNLVEGLEKIGSYAFSFVEKLNTLYFPSSLKEIGTGAFEANSYRKLYYYGTLEDWCNIQFASRNSNPIHDDYIYALNSKNEWEEVLNIIIPSNITVIGAYQFAGFNGYAKYTFHENIERIEKGAFSGAGMGGYDWWGLVDISNTKVTTIEAGAFADTYMKTILLPNTVKEIESGAFSNNRYLETIGLCDGIESVGPSAFSKCIALEEMILPNTVTSVGESAFSQCSSLKNIHIPASVTKMAARMFEGCVALETLHMPFIAATEPGSTTIIPKGSNMLGYYFNTYHQEGMAKVIQQVITYENSSTIPILQEEYTYYIPESLYKITIDRGNLENGAFNNCSMLKEVVHNGQSSYSFAFTSFEGCEFLRSLTLTNKITDIYRNAFKNCYVGTIYYQGTQSEWNKVAKFNMNLEDTNIVFNHTA